MLRTHQPSRTRCADVTSMSRPPSPVSSTPSTMSISIPGTLTGSWHGSRRRAEAGRQRPAPRRNAAPLASLNNPSNASVQPGRLQPKFMSPIQRTITVSFEHRVSFTRNVFGLGNPVLNDALHSEPGQPAKVLVVLDESLHQAQPALAPQIEGYFRKFGDTSRLVCPPVILEGGERVKNSYFHVSEIQ